MRPHFLLVWHLVSNECWSLHLTTHFSSISLCRRLAHNSLSGTIPPQISILTELVYLYAPSLNQTIECWSYIYWVLVTCFIECWSCQVFISCRMLYNNDLKGTVPPQISTLTKLSVLYAPNGTFYWVLVLYASLSAFQEVCLFSSQGSLVQRTDWDNPSADICAGWASISVGPHFFLICVGQSLLHFCFNKCWPCAPLSHIFQFHHKYQRWQSWQTCMPQNGTFIEC